MQKTALKRTRGYVHLLRLLALFVAGSTWSTFAVALDPQRALYQYAHNVWRTEEGNFEGTPTQILQDADGYIWVGTSTNLTRLVGGSFASPDAARSRSIAGVNSLVLARDGTIWVGGPGGLQAIRHSQLLQVSSWQAEIRSVMEASDGTIWVTRLRIRDGKGPLCKVVGLDLRCYGAEAGIPEKFATALAEDGTGVKWFGSSSVRSWRDGRVQSYPYGQPTAIYGEANVRYLLPQPTGEVLAALDVKGSFGGVQQYGNGSWKGYNAVAFHGSSITANVIFRDKEGALWVGTVDEGVYRIWNGKADHFKMSDGLSSDQVNAVREDAEGNVWVATIAGVDCFRDIPVADYTPHRGLTRSLNGPVLARPDGSVWIAEKGGIDVWRAGRITPLQAKIGQTIRALYEDRSHRVWIASDNQLLVYDDGRLRAVSSSRKRDEKHMAETISSIAQDETGAIWAILSRSGARTLLQIENYQVVRTIKLPAEDRAKWLAGDKDGGLWVGANSGELSYLKNGQRSFIKLPTSSSSFGVTDLRVTTDDTLLLSTGIGLFLKTKQQWRVLNKDRGLPCSTIYSALDDRDANLWLFGECGLLRVSNADLQRLQADELFRVHPRVFGRLEGVFPGAQDGQPSAALAAGGKLWFTNGVVLQMIDPERLRDNLRPPPVYIDTVIADHKAFAPLGKLELPPNTKDLEIEYSGLSYVQPSSVVFRYKLEGQDDTWQEVGTRHSAFYNQLPPGRYRFSVMACNNDGVWNTTGAALDIVVAAAPYQTLWFKCLVLSTLIVALWMLYTVRLEQAAEAVKARLIAQMEERERIARDLHDTFFQGMQGLLLRFQTATSQLPRHEPAKVIFEQALEQSDDVMLEGRGLVLDIRHEEGLFDLVDLFTKAGQRFQQDDSIRFSVVVNGNATSLHPIVVEELSKLGREALFNAFLHSKGSHITVEVSYTEAELRLLVEDDGIGIEPIIVQNGGIPGHWGLPGMQERARTIGAHLSILSHTHTGTRIEVRVPAAVAYQRRVRYIVKMRNHIISHFRRYLRALKTK